RFLVYMFCHALSTSWAVTLVRGVRADPVNMKRGGIIGSHRLQQLLKSKRLSVVEALEFFTRCAVQYPNAAQEPLEKRPCKRPSWSRKATFQEDYDGVREIPGVLE
ncbi:MAG: hypothetical protein OXD30_01490, partial [Bryobacterales bacterium]|nr:hypothetical protein [Bryobacterales bacterium]